jgi:hypothetical protein
LGELDIQDIGLDYFQPGLIGEPAAEVIDHRRVQLNGYHVACAGQQVLRQGAFSGADFYDSLTDLARCLGYAVEDGLAVEEVLAQLLAGHQPRTTMWSPTFLNVTRILPEKG